MKKKFLPAKIHVRGTGCFEIQFTATHPQTGERKRFQRRYGINHLPTKSQRLAEAKRICSKVNRLLPLGYPFVDIPDREDEFLTISVAVTRIVEQDRQARGDDQVHYQAIAEQFCTWVLSGDLRWLHIADFSVGHAFDFMDWATARHGRDVFESYLMVMRSIFRMLLRKGQIEANPWLKVEPERELERFLPLQRAIELGLVAKRSDRDRTNQRYHYCTKKLFKWIDERGIAQIHVGHFTRRHAEAFMYDLAGHLAPRTWNSELDTLRPLWNYFIKQEWIDKNPFSAVEKKTETEKIRQPISREQKAVIIDAVLTANKPALSLAVALIYYCGIRVEEFRRLRRGSIDLEAGVVRVAGRTSKTKKNRIPTIAREIIPFLAGHPYLQVPEDWLLFGKRAKPHPSVPVGRNTLSAQFRDLVRGLKAAGKLTNIEGITLYSWKDTFASDMEAADFPIRGIQLHFGHHSPEMTQRYMKQFKGADKKIQGLQLQLMPQNRVAKTGEGAK